MTERRVLVVGRSCESVGCLLRRLFEQGNEVESAFDAPAAIALLSQWQPDVILLTPPLEQLDVPALLVEMQRQRYTGSIVVAARNAADALEAIRKNSYLGGSPAELGPEGLPTNAVAATERARSLRRSPDDSDSAGTSEGDRDAAAAGPSSTRSLVRQSRPWR